MTRPSLQVRSSWVAGTRYSASGEGGLLNGGEARCRRECYSGMCKGGDGTTVGVQKNLEEAGKWT
jgi:hypothetical protein